MKHFIILGTGLFWWACHSPDSELQTVDQLPDLTSYDLKLEKFDNALHLCQSTIEQMAPSLKRLREYLLYKPDRKRLMLLSKLKPKHCTQSKTKKRANRLTKSVLKSHSKRVGIILPLSGPQQALGQSALKGILSSCENDKCREKFIVRDSEGNPNRALSSLADLVFNHEVSLLIGGLLNTEAQVLAPFARGIMTPMLLLNRSGQLIKAFPYTFKVFPDERYLAKSLAQAIRQQGLRKVGILSPRKPLKKIAKHLEEELQKLGVKSLYREYDAEEFESINAVVKDFAGLNINERRGDYRKAYRRAQEKARQEGHAFNPRFVILDPKLKVDAVFIPDSSRIVRHFVKILRYHGVEKLQLLGNQQWRSSELLDPWDELLSQALFVDYMGLPKNLPQALRGVLSQVSEPDFLLFGYRAGQIASSVMEIPFTRKLDIVTRMLQQKEDFGYFRARRIFNPDRSATWPSFLFTIKHRGFRLVRKETNSSYVNSTL